MTLHSKGRTKQPLTKSRRIEGHNHLALKKRNQTTIHENKKKQGHNHLALKRRSQTTNDKNKGKQGHMGDCTRSILGQQQYWLNRSCCPKSLLLRQWSKSHARDPTYQKDKHATRALQKCITPFTLNCAETLPKPPQQPCAGLPPLMVATNCKNWWGHASSAGNRTQRLCAGCHSKASNM